ncbi:MAG TPA: tetratricopeptide repeat protein, partial [Candidatus Eisenbacteria bacterium]|nr:tetratricopeptide repeat protein [Candidatus Eisenbacteria bacterium]
WLRGLSFVHEQDGICRYHELVRAPMLRLQRERSIQRWRRHHRRLADLQLESRVGLELSDAEGWADEVWQRCALEETYHRLCATPVAALPAALAGALHAYRASRPLARQWTEMLRQAGRDADASDIARWGAELTAAAGEDEDCWIGFVTALLDRAPLAAPERATALGQRAECHTLDRRFSAALADFERALELDPGNAALVVARGQTLRVMGRFQGALRDMDRAIELAPEGETAIATRGVILHRLGRFDEAVADLTRAIRLRPSDEWALAHRGESYRAMGRHWAAIADFTEAIRLNPTYAWAHASRALARRRLGHHREELADLDHALELSPGYEWAWAQRGVAHRHAGRYEQAIADLTRAIELDPQYAWAVANRGVTYRQVGRYEEAVADLDRALALEPTSPWARVNRGVTLRQMGRYREALAELDAVVATRLDDAWAVGNRGETLRLLGRDREALADLDRALELRPSAWTLARRGATRRRLGDVGGALADFERALELDPTEGAARFGRALVLLGTGRRDEAEAELDAAVTAGMRSLEARPGDPVGLLRLVVYEAARGHGKAAPPLCREALARGAAGALVEATIRELHELREVAVAGVGDGTPGRIDRLVELLTPAATVSGG